MADISVKCSGLRSAADDLNECASLLANASQDVENVINTLHLSTNSLNSIKRSLRAQKTSITNEKYKCTRMAAVARQSASLYENTENKVAGHSRVGKITIEDIISNIRNSVINDGNYQIDPKTRKEIEKLLKFINIINFPAISTIPSVSIIEKIWGKRKREVHFTSEEIDLIEKFSSRRTNTNNSNNTTNNSQNGGNTTQRTTWRDKVKKIKDFNDNHKKEQFVTIEKDSNGNVVRKTLTDDEAEKVKDSSMNRDITIASVGDSASVSAWEKRTPSSENSGLLSGEAGVSAFNANASYNAYAGLYSYKEDGTRVFTPGIGAEIGAGVSAFTADAKGQIGNEYFNIHGSANLTLLEANAKASADVGLMDANGNLNPRISAGVSAEANLAKVEGTVGGTIGGTQINATGGLVVGAGAHANVGYKDGKITVDVGASLGIGASVKLDIDASKTIDTIAKNADKIADGVSKAANSLWKKSKAAWNSIW